MSRIIMFSNINKNGLVIFISLYAGFASEVYPLQWKNIDLPKSILTEIENCNNL